MQEDHVEVTDTDHGSNEGEDSTVKGCSRDLRISPPEEDPVPAQACDSFQYSGICKCLWSLPIPRLFLKCISCVTKNTSASFTEAAYQTDLTSAEVEALINECNARNEQVCSLQNEVHRLQISKESFQCSDSKVNFYTGLQNFACLLALCGLLERYVSHSEQCKLQKFHEFLVFLMKLK